MEKIVKIASGQGFWGDLPSAPVSQVKQGDVDYLMMDYLAEVTMSIMQKQKLKRPEAGYARDFVEVVRSILPEIMQGKVKVVSNAGGVNPHACKDAILKAAEEEGVSGFKIAVVDGDDILDQITELTSQGHELKNMDTGEPITDVADQLLSANVYFGADPVVKALEAGADVIITGRVTDTGLCLGPMIYEFGWSMEDYDKMAAGTVAGHILECGAQSSGGNYTDWKEIDNFAEIGFPIVEATPDGKFIVAKHEKTGGIINLKSIKEQLLYEIGDPADYITPDCVADFTSIQLDQKEKSRVQVYGIKGSAPTDFYKVSASYKYGYKLSATLVYSWPDALEKAKSASEILKKRADNLGLKLDDYRTEYIGFNGCSEEPMSEDVIKSDFNEIQLRVSAASSSRQDLDRLGREVAPLILTGPSSVTGFAGGRPKASEVVAYWPALIKKEACTPQVNIYQA